MSDLPGAAWRRSSRCVSDHHCVEMMDLGDAVGMRNSRRPEFSLTISRQAWRDLVDGLKAGEFDAGRI